MNSETRALLIKILLTLATSAATYFHSTSQLTPAIASDLIDIGVFCWSLYANRGMKLVPTNSVAIQHVDGSKPALNIGDSTNAITKVVGALLVALTLFSQGEARAVPFCIDPLNKIPVGCIPRPAGVGPGTAVAKNLMDLLNKDMQALASFINSDFTQAQTLSGVVANMPDGNGNACWSMLLSAKNIFQAAPPDQPLPGAATVLEQLRLLAMVANRVCQNAACTQVFTEAGNALNTVAPIPNLPSLTSLCSKVPQVASVAITPAQTITVSPEAVTKTP